MKFITLTIALLFFLFDSKAQDVKSPEPIFFIDSVRVTSNDLQAYDANDISVLTVYKDSSAIKMMGQEAKYGLVYIETKKFAKARYWRYFKSKSKEYLQIVPSIENDSNIQYILNGRVLTEKFEGDLSAIDDKVFKSLQVISKEQLTKDYKVTDKDYGVIIISATPENLHRGKEKFSN